LIDPTRLAGIGWVRIAALALYYLAVMVALAVLSGRTTHVTPRFVYQAF
jgi:hypothetical protein